MSETHEENPNQRIEGSTSDLINELLRPDTADERDRLAQARVKSKLWRIVVVGVLLFFFTLLVIGLLAPAVVEVSVTAESTASLNNLREMGLAMNTIASTTTTGDIPPANGRYPPNGDRTASFFEHLLPYIGQGTLYLLAPQDVPVNTYISPTDPRNPRNNATISYCTNATVLSGTPQLPASFGGRTTSIICVMERSGLDGAHTWTNSNNFLGSPGNPPAFPQMEAGPNDYLDASPQGFTAAGCMVMLGDGSARPIRKMQTTTWQWACDPKNRTEQPPDW